MTPQFNSFVSQLESKEHVQSSRCSRQGDANNPFDKAVNQDVGTYGMYSYNGIRSSDGLR
jgi:hypothetical protein